MPAEPKTWTDSEIINLIVETMTVVRQDARDRGLTLKTRDLAENILAALDTNYLIERTP